MQSLALQVRRLAIQQIRLLRLAEDLTRSHGVELPLANAVKLRFEEAAAQGWADADIGAVVELLRGRTGGSPPADPT